MPLFPTQYSTLKASALNGYISRKYGFSNMNCRLLIRNVSDTYLLEGSGEKYILKIYRESHRSLDEIMGELELLDFLYQNGASVAHPIADLSGSRIQQFEAAEGIRTGVLFSFARGKAVRDLNREQIVETGREMARVHNFASSVTLTHYRHAYDLNSTLLHPLQTLEPHFADMKEDYDWLKETAVKVIRKIETLDMSGFSVGYCHYDFLPKNFHFDENNRVTFFDFDFAGKGYLVNDIMTFFVHFFLHSHTGRSSHEQAERDFGTFIESYRTVRPLSDEEIKAIPYFGYAFWIFYMEFHYLNYEDWSNIFLTPAFTKDRVQLIRQWVSRYCNFDVIIP